VDQRGQRASVRRLRRVPMLVRTWNVFHGNTSPPRRQAHLREMVELITYDGPAVVCLQEVPVWALAHLERWSGMRASGAVAARPRLGSAELGRLITELDHGLFRSAFTGQANAILTDRDFRDERAIVVSTSGERRVYQSVGLDDDTRVANVHVAGGPPGAPQLERMLELVEALDDRVILAGDLNVRPEEDRGAYARLEALGFSDPLAGSIDQILVRGLPSTPPAAWPDERRRLRDFLLSDHAPVELTVG
jgi:endonuclease/exonuclease/phosphatase family metal-dependent hydrolase